jgi:uncharacterized protein
MSRLLFLVVIAAIVYWLLKSYRKQMPEDEGAPVAETMVRCLHCGVHFPKSDGIVAGNNYYCSEAHRRAHMDKPE